MGALAHRPASEADEPFVVDSWIRSWRDSMLTELAERAGWSRKELEAAGVFPLATWREVTRTLIRGILARPGVDVLVAYHPGEADTQADLYGWIAVERATPPLVHYAYTKQAYRRLGIARGLLAAAGVDPAAPFRFSVRTALVERPGVRSKIPRAQWDPTAMRPNRSPTRYRSTRVREQARTDRGGDHQVQRAAGRPRPVGSVELHREGSGD